MKERLIQQIKEYHLVNDEGEEEVLAPVTPIRSPEMWMVPFTQRNYEMLELAAESMMKAQSPLAQELTMILVNADVMRPKK